MLLDKIEKSEVINGEIFNMTPSPNIRHSEVISNILLKLGVQIDNSVCRIYGDNVDMIMDETNDYVVPDISIICDRSKIKNGKYYGAPKFVVEILSPSTRKKDRTVKMKYYERNGVSEYWIVDYSAKAVEIYYLENGKYELVNAPQIDEDAEEQEEMTITLRDFPHLKITLEEIFE